MLPKVCAVEVGVFAPPADLAELAAAPGEGVAVVFGFGVGTGCGEDAGEVAVGEEVGEVGEVG